MATVWTTMEKTPEGRFMESGYHLEEPANPYRRFTVDDPEEFIAHMRRFNSIPKTALPRDQYEKICDEFGVKPVSDSELDIFGTTFTTLGTSNYHFHTEPENRELGISNTIHGLRYRAIRTENI
ncbi:MAG: hypothetical protein C0622_08520 [Desulfuromonas sp.]|nr:MAG: hypothetical protein C0622_08520 [Desulfuromonas sp.]